MVRCTGAAINSDSISSDGRMTRSRSLLASILGGFVSSDLRRAGPSSRLDNDPAPRLLLILTWQAPPLRHTTPVFSRRACLFLLSCTPSPLPPPPSFPLSLRSLFSGLFSSASPRPIAILDHAEGGLEKIALGGPLNFFSNSRIMGRYGITVDPQLILYTMILTKGVSISHANSRFHSRSLIVDETSAGIRREGKMDSFRSVTVLNRREREFLLIGGATVVGQVYRKIHPRQTYILRALTTSLDLESRQKKSCHSHGRIVGETSKSQRILRRTIVSFFKVKLSTYKEERGRGRKRVRKKTRTRREGKKKKKRKKREREKKEEGHFPR